MIKFLTSIINFIKSSTRAITRNKVFKIISKLFLFMGSFAIIRWLFMSLSLTRKALSIFSTILILILTDFNPTSIIGAITVMFSNTPEILTGYFNNIASYFSNKLTGSSKLSISTPDLPSTSTTKQIIKDAIEEKKPFVSLREKYAGKFNFDWPWTQEEEVQSNSYYKYYLVIGICAVAISVTYIYSSEIAAFLSTHLKDLSPSDKPSGSDSPPASPPSIPLIDPNVDRVLHESNGLKLWQKDQKFMVESNGVFISGDEFEARIAMIKEVVESVASSSTDNVNHTPWLESRSLSPVASDSGTATPTQR